MTETNHAMSVSRERAAWATSGYLMLLVFLALIVLLVWRFFGFAGRASGGNTALGTVLEGTLDVPIRKHWSVNGYAGTMSAGPVVRNWFTSRRLTFFYLENVVRF